MPEKARLRRRLWLSLGLFVVALAWLSFARESVYYVGQSDAPSYLAVARSEPAHSAFAGKFYLVHPPAYPCAIRAASWITGDLVSGGVLLGLVASAALVLVTFQLGLALGLPEAAALAGALFLLASRALQFGAHGVYREPWEVLLIHGLVLSLVTGGGGARRERARLALALVTGALAAWTWDPVGLAAPLVAALGALSGQRRRGLLAGAAVLVAWLVWAEFRREVLVSGPRYPAGIDGTLESTQPLPWLALVNPNFLEETRVHNAYWWPRHPTPEHLLSLMGPEALAASAPFLDVAQPRLFEQVGAALLLLAGAGGVAVALGARQPDGRARAKTVLGIALLVGFLGAGGLTGFTARYSVTVVPLLCLLAASGAVELAAFFSRGSPAKLGSLKASLALLGTGSLLALVWDSSGHFVMTRPTLFEGRAVAHVIETLEPDARIAAANGWPSELAWLLPRCQVLALPRRVYQLDEFFQEYRSDVLVVPLEIKRRKGDANVPPDEIDGALGVSALASIMSELASPQLSGPTRPVSLGYVVEAEVTDEPRIHVCQILARAGPARLPFGFYLPPGEGEAVRRAILAGRARPVELALLRDHRDALARAGERELVDLLEKLR